MVEQVLIWIGKQLPVCAYISSALLTMYFVAELLRAKKRSKSSRILYGCLDTAIVYYYFHVVAAASLVYCVGLVYYGYAGLLPYPAFMAVIHIMIVLSLNIEYHES